MTEQIVQTVMYLGRPVDKAHFRAYIYGANGLEKLVNSWNEFQTHMQTGLWFATRHEACASVVIDTPKLKRGNKGAVTVKDDHHPLDEV